MNNFCKRIISPLIRTNFKTVLIMNFLLFLILLTSGNVFAVLPVAMQPITITGQITDGKTGESLPGVNVVIEGTTTGVITDISGKFTIQVPNRDAVIVVSYIGFLAQKFPVKDVSVINVQLLQDVKAIDEVVVIGYGAQKKESVVGAIAVVSNKDLERRGGVYNLASAISGQIGGVTVMEQNGEPGRDDPQILIRGQSTWNGSQPLILVDGIERKMNDIDVNEVANISVLKDASATAVFGVKGANGVILITTKRGEVGKPQLTFSAHQGVKSLSKMPKVMDSFDARSWKNAAVAREVATNEAAWAYFIPYEQLLRSKTPQIDPFNYLYPNVDWQDVMLKDYAKNSRYNMNISGGTEFAKYFASLGYQHEADLLASEYNDVKGYDPGYAYDRFNFRGNLDFNLTKTTILSSNINGYIGNQKTPNANFGGDAGSMGHIFRGIYELAPDIFPVKYPDGFYGKDPANININNPLAILQEGGVYIRNRRHIGTDMKIVQKLDFITKGLSVAANVAWDNYAVSEGPSINDSGNQGQAIYEYINPAILDAKTRQDTLNNVTYHTTAGQTGRNDYDFSIQPWTKSTETASGGSFERSLFYQASLNYARVFDKHNVSGLFLFNRRQNATGGEFANFREDWVGRTTYNYDDKYFAEFNGAYNGSEKFSSLYRFGFFPSMALGWMVSNESFLKQIEWLSKLKIRGSIGKVGSDAGIPRWGYVGSWIYPGSGEPSTSWFYANNGTITASPYKTYREGAIPNPNIRWETATKQNLGVEVSILQNMITLDMDFFKDNREDIFMTASRRNIPNFFGATAVPANLGATETKGYELELGVNKTWQNGLGFWLKANMTNAKDVVTKSEDPSLLFAYQKVVGHRIGQTFSTTNAGFMNNWDDVFASSPATANMIQRLPGDWDTNDFNGDGIINTFDSAPYGYPSRPQHTYNYTFGFNYKNLAIMVQFFAENNITLAASLVLPGTTRWTPVSSEFRDYWTPENTDATYRAPRVTTSASSGNFYNWDASFVRLKTAEISYRLPVNLTKRIGISSARIYLNGNNIILWSDFPVDRETGSFDIQNSYPLNKTMDLGIDISF